MFSTLRLIGTILTLQLVKRKKCAISDFRSLSLVCMPTDRKKALLAGAPPIAANPILTMSIERFIIFTSNSCCVFAPLLQSNIHSAKLLNIKY